MYNNEEHRKIVENRKYIYIGSYDIKELTIDNKNKNKNKIHIRVKRPYCEKEYDIDIYSFKNGCNCIYCCNKYENSLVYYIQQEIQEPLNKYWDWNKNIISPYCIAKNSHKKIWIKCTKTDYHGSYEVICSHFQQGNRCPYCNSFASKKVHPKDSFAQWGIDNIDRNFLEKYRSDKNTLNPRELAKQSSKKVWIKCQNKDYHEDYLVTCSHFFNGRRCPYCTNNQGKVHPKDSFGALYPEKAKYRSKRNNKSPYEVTPRTGAKYWFYCEDCGTEFLVSLDSLNNNRSMKCLNCTSSKGEQKIKDWLNNNKFSFISQKKFFGLVGLNGGNLSYDFYLPNNNLLIEYQGQQHEKYIKGLHNFKKDFEKQKEHDKRKREYAKFHNIDLLEIRYWDFDNIEEILQDKIVGG